MLFQTDWSAVATKANFKTAKYAHDPWSGVKNKLAVCGNATTIPGNDDAASSAGVDDTAATGGKAKKATSRKRKAGSYQSGLVTI